MQSTTLTTNRIVLRPWHEDDAAALYLLARDPKVGPRAGWQPHEDEADSLRIIRGVLSVPETYALVLRTGEKTGALVGSVGLRIGRASDLAHGSNEAEMGCWVGRCFWGQGYAPEALRELTRHGFEDLALDAIWYGYYEGNEQSRRVQEKLGFVPDHIIEDEPRPLLGDTARTHVSLLTRERWRCLRAQAGALPTLPS